jgi:hypothetical protein
VKDCGLNRPGAYTTRLLLTAIATAPIRESPDVSLSLVTLGEHLLLRKERLILLSISLSAKASNLRGTVEVLDLRLTVQPGTDDLVQELA